MSEASAATQRDAAGTEQSVRWTGVGCRDRGLSRRAVQGDFVPAGKKLRSGPEPFEIEVLNDQRTCDGTRSFP